MKSWLYVLASLLMAASGMVHAQHAQKVSSEAMQAAQRNGKVRVLVMLQDQAPARAVRDNVLRRQQVAQEVGGALSRLPVGDYTVKRRFALVPAFAVEVNEKALQRLRDDPAVARVDIDAPGHGNGVAPDESSVLNTVSQLQGKGYGGAGMKVALIDSGIDTDHPDLAPRLIAQQCFCSNSSGTGGCCPNGLATQSGTGAAEDAWGHGTNVAGIILGQGNVAPRGAVPAAQLVAVRTLNASGAFCCSSDIVAAMDWVANNHPDVDAVNLSLGTSAMFDGDCDTATSYTQALSAAVNNLIAKGAVVTVSSGNTGNTKQMQAPACVRNAMSVGATWDFTGGARTFLGCTETSTAPRQPTCFTNRSATTDMFAAGAMVTATGINGGTSTWGGTSQAAPMVAACAIALKQIAPYSTPLQRMEAMRVSSSYILFDPVEPRTYPFLDCVAALDLLRPRKAAADFNADGRSDLLWRHAATGNDAIWLSADSATRQAIAALTPLDWKAVAIGDFSGDRKADIYWRNTSTGANVIWRSGNSATQQSANGFADLAWSVVGTGDFDGDTLDDVLWRNASTGANSLLLGYGFWRSVASVPNLAWQVAGTGDFNGDGRADILWRNTSTGANVIWKSAESTQTQAVTAVTQLSWKVAGTGDFNGDGKADIFWRNTSTGVNVIWRSANYATPQAAAAVSDQNWKVAAVGDYNGDGKSDVLWRHATTGNNDLWYSGNSTTHVLPARAADVNWKIVP